MSQAEDSGNAKERILASASALFAEHGFDGIAVSDIALASGTSTGLIYYHFTDKQTLYEQAVRGGVHLLEELAVGVLTDEAQPAEKLRRFVAAYMQLLEGHVGLMRLLIRSMSDLGGPVPTHVLMRSSAIVHRLQAVIEEGIAAGAFRKLDAHLAATALFALINTLITARVLETPLGTQAEPDIQAQSAFMTDLFLGGIAAC